MVDERKSDRRRITHEQFFGVMSTFYIIISMLTFLLGVLLFVAFNDRPGSTSSFAMMMVSTFGFVLLSLATWHEKTESKKDQNLINRANET